MNKLWSIAIENPVIGFVANVWEEKKRTRSYNFQVYKFIIYYFSRATVMN